MPCSGATATHLLDRFLRLVTVLKMVREVSKAEEVNQDRRNQRISAAIFNMLPFQPMPDFLVEVVKVHIPGTRSSFHVPRNATMSSDALTIKLFITCPGSENSATRVILSVAFENTSILIMPRNSSVCISQNEGFMFQIPKFYGVSNSEFVIQIPAL
jgi:hypothetical protein